MTTNLVAYINTKFFAYSSGIQKPKILELAELRSFWKLVFASSSFWRSHLGLGYFLHLQVCDSNLCFHPQVCFLEMTLGPSITQDKLHIAKPLI